MPGRPHLLINNYIYHIYNKTIEGKKVLRDENLCNLFLEISRYYRSSQSILRYSKFSKLSPELKTSYDQKISDPQTFRVSILAHTLMPTHYHFLLKQNQKNGISSFISLIQNSFTRYFNIKNEKSGPIFLHRFKSKPIHSEEHLKHVSRYIHLNCFSSGIVTDENEIENYPWSSLHEYLFPSSKPLCETNYLLPMFNNNRDRYKRFIQDNAQHQRMLEHCKYADKW